MRQTYTCAVALILLCLTSCGAGNQASQAPAPTNDNPAETETAEVKLPELKANEAGANGKVLSLVDGGVRVYDDNRVAIVLTTFEMTDDEQRARVIAGGQGTMGSAFRLLETKESEVYVEIVLTLKERADSLSKDNVLHWHYALVRFTEAVMADRFEGAEHLDELGGELAKGAEVYLKLALDSGPPESDEDYYYFNIDRSVPVVFAP